MDSPFPPLTFEEFQWEGVDVLPGWTGVQSRLGSYTSVDRSEASDGRVSINVSPPNGEASRAPASEQAVAYARLKRDDPAIAEAVRRAVLDYARNLDEAYGLPNELDLPSLRGMIGLGIVHVLNVAKEGEAYVGFELGCEWDEEHGCGVMTHRGRIVSVGAADEAFEGWIAERDGGTDLA